MQRLAPEVDVLLREQATRLRHQRGQLGGHDGFATGMHLAR